MATFDSFNEIHDMLGQFPGLSDSIGMEKGMAFVRLATRLKDEIVSRQKAGYEPTEPPDSLPENVQEFMGKAVDIPAEYVWGCWTAFRRTIWQRDGNGDSRGEDAKLFKLHGLQGLLCECVFAAVGRLF
jgi:hypothetical protein